MNSPSVFEDWAKPENITLSKRELERRKEALGIENISEITPMLAEKSAAFQKNQPQAPPKQRRYRSYYNSKPGGLLQADLMTLATKNNKYQRVELNSSKTEFPYLLIVIDTFSRYLWAIPLESKAAKHVHSAIDKVIENLKEIYFAGDPLNVVRFKILSDAGKEFTGYQHAQVKSLISTSKFGASLAEAAIKKVRNLIRLFCETTQEEQSRTFSLTTEELAGLITNINTSINSSVSDTFSPQEILMENVSSKAKSSAKFPLAPTKYRAGQYVRLINYQEREPNSYGTKSQVSSLFVKRSMFNNFTEKIFSILEIFVDTVDNLRIFKLVSIDGTFLLERKWYEFEISQPISLEFVKTMSDEERDACEDFSPFEQRFYNIRYTTEEDFE